MNKARIILTCLSLMFLVSVVLSSTVPNYLNLGQQTEKWYKSEGAGKFATLRMHTLVNGFFNGAVILKKEIWLNSDVIESNRLLFKKDVDGNILFFGDLDGNVLDDPILWVDAPLTVGKTWTDSRPEIPCCNDPETFVHYVFAVLDTKEIHCPSGVFACYRLYLAVIYPDGQTENQSFWYSPTCGMVMCAMDNQRIFELQKVIIPDAVDYPERHVELISDGNGISGLKASPNPLNPMTNISFDLRSKSRVNLRVYDVSGKLVRTLIEGDIMDPGTRSALWNGKDNLGSPVASGTYIYRLQAGGTELTNRMTLIR